MAISATNPQHVEHRIESLDLEGVIELARRTYRWAPEAGVIQAAQEYRDFLWVCWTWWSANHPERLAGMGCGADRIWHCHMLLPHRYVVDCASIFGPGHILDHDPFFNEREMPEALKDAEEAYREAHRTFPADRVDICRWSVVTPI